MASMAEVNTLLMAFSDFVGRLARDLGGGFGASLAVTTDLPSYNDVVATKPCSELNINRGV